VASAGLGTRTGAGDPFSADAAAYARRLAAGRGLAADPARELAELLARWKNGIVAGRAERRMAARLAAQYAALPLAAEPTQSTEPLEPVASSGGDAVVAELQIVSDDDDEADPADESAIDDDEDFYADAFEVLT
jgi:putative transposase